MPDLYPHQTRLVADLRDAYRRRHRAVLVVSPTGSGKTVTFCHTAALASSAGRRVLITAHRIEIVWQIIDTLRSFGLEPGRILSGEPEDRLNPVQVAMAQTLAGRISRGEVYGYDYLVVDEAHHAIPGSSWGRIIDHVPTARVAGYTATPERLDGRGLGTIAGGFFSEMVLGPSVRDLIDMGKLAMPIAYGPPARDAGDFSDVGVVAGDYKKGEIDQAVEQRVVFGDVLSHYRRFLDRQPTILFATSVRAAEARAEDFRRAGYRAAALEGSTKIRDRRRMIRDLGAGQLDVLTSCQVIDEGTDIPAVAGAIFLAPTASLARALQREGRPLRPKATGDNVCYLIDHVGLIRTHGLPQEDRDWTLEGRPKRQRKKDDEGPPVKQCEECGAWVPAQTRTCPYCRTQFGTPKPAEPVQVETDLVRIEEERARAARKKEEGMAQTYHELVALGKSRGYKNPGFWAKKKIEGRLAARGRG